MYALENKCSENLSQYEDVFVPLQPGSSKDLHAPTTGCLCGVRVYLGNMSPFQGHHSDYIPSAQQENNWLDSRAPHNPSTLIPTPPCCSCLLGGLENCACTTGFMQRHHSQHSGSLLTHQLMAITAHVKMSGSTGSYCVLRTLVSEPLGNSETSSN